MKKIRNKRDYKSRNRLLVLAMAFMFLTGIFGITFPVSASESFHSESRESVAVVYTCLELNAGEYGFGWGTGFFVGKTGEDPTYLVTNYHVISDYVEYGSGELVSGTIDGMEVQGRSKIRVYFGANDYVPAYMVSGDEGKDIGILKLEKATSKRIPISLCSPTDALVGSTVYAVGYPGLSDNVIAEPTSSWDVTDASVTKGTVNRIFTTEGTGRANLQIDCVIRHGNSGGPLINGDGAVVGVNTWSVSSSSDDADIYYAVSIDEAILMLNQSGITYTMYSDTAGGTAGSSGTEGTNGTEGNITDPVTNGTGTNGAEIQPAPAPSSGNGGLIVAVVVMAVVILAGGGAAVFFLIRKNKSKSPQSGITGSNISYQQPVSPQAPRRDASSGQQHGRGSQGIRLIAVGGYMDGRTYPVDGNEITFGRDVSATVCFPADAKGVSRQHCRIFWQNGTLMLMDSGSSYGTYTQAGKLQPMKPVPVKSGDVFYIGEKKNCFKIQ